MKRQERIVRILRSRGPEMVQMPLEVHRRAVQYMEELVRGRTEDREQLIANREETLRKVGDLDVARARIDQLERRNVARTGFIAVLLALLLGFLAYPIYEWSQRLPYENSFEACVEVYDEIEPDGVFREDLDRHYDNVGRCHLIVAYSGEDQFIKDFSSSTYVDEIRNIRGE